jgi:hypothetical protein
MAQLYFDHQLVATDQLDGVISSNLIDKTMDILYKHKKNKFYTIFMYDEEVVHFFKINIKGELIDTGEDLVDEEPLVAKPYNYNTVIHIYEQPRKLPLPKDDFDMTDYVNKHQLHLLYKIEFTILQQLNVKPNIFSNRTFNSKLQQHVR